MTRSSPDDFDLAKFYRENPTASEAAACLNATAFALRPGSESRRYLVQALAAATLLARQQGGTLDLPTFVACLHITPEELAHVEREIRAETGGGGVH